MKILRTALAFAALLVPLLANAGVLSFSFHGTLGNFNPTLDSIYPHGTPISGVFHIDAGIPAQIRYEDYSAYYGAFSGTVNVADNSIHFAHSFAYIQNIADPQHPLTYMTMLGGDRWNTGGTISETQPPAGMNIDGFQIMFIYPELIDTDTTIHDFLTAIPASYASLYLSYGGMDGVWGDISEIIPLSEPAPVPEPSGLLLVCLGMMAFLAARIRRQAPTA